MQATTENFVESGYTLTVQPIPRVLAKYDPETARFHVTALDGQGNQHCVANTNYDFALSDILNQSGWHFVVQAWQVLEDLAEVHATIKQDGNGLYHVMPSGNAFVAMRPVRDADLGTALVTFSKQIGRLAKDALVEIDSWTMQDLQSVLDDQYAVELTRYGACAGMYKLILKAFGEERHLNGQMKEMVYSIAKQAKMLDVRVA